MITDASRWELEPTPWTGLAACKGCKPDLWFPERGDSTRQALAICDTCPVQSECLDYALRWNITDGVWGGKTVRQRQAIRARTHPPRPRLLPASHGTTTRYARGCRCDHCRDATWQSRHDRRDLFESDHARVADVRPNSRFL